MDITPPDGFEQLETEPKTDTNPNNSSGELPPVSLEEEIERLINAWTDQQIGYTTRRSMILATVQAELDALDMQFKPTLDALAEHIKERVVKHGASVSTQGASASFVKGSLKVDVAKLEGYAVAHPEVRQFISAGKPTCRLTFKGD